LNRKGDIDMNMEWLAWVFYYGGAPVNTSFLPRADKEAALLQHFIGAADVQAARLFEGGPTGGGKQVMATTTALGWRWRG
jgi:hypothetical protein